MEFWESSKYLHLDCSPSGTHLFTHTFIMERV